MNALVSFWKNHATKFLGTLVTILSGALALGLIPASYVQYANGLLALLGGTTVKRGFTNSANAPSA